MRRHAKVIVAAVSALLLLGVTIGSTLATAAAPSVTIDAPSDVSYTSAHISGTINPNGGPSPITYYLEYRAVGDQGWTYVEAGQISGAEAEGTGPIAVGGNLTGLKPGTEYEARLDAYVDGVENYSPEPHPTFTTDPVAAPTVSIDDPSQVTGSAAHFSGQVNPNAPGAAPQPAAFDTTWRFECTPECPGLSGTIPADNDSHTVEVDATGLLADTEYEVTLIATNAGGSVSAGPESFTTDAMAPEVLSARAAPLSSEAALQAQINPRGLQTTYHFEYGPTAGYGQSTAPMTLGSTGSLPALAKASIFGLVPGATYHFRVVAENALGVAQGSDGTFTTYSYSGVDTCPNAAIRAAQAATQLGRCRAFEKVSPADKNGSNVSLAPGQSSPDGNAVHFQSSGAFAGAEGSGHVDDYIARRGPGGWTTSAIAPYQTPYSLDPIAEGGARGYEMFTPDLSRGIFAGWHDPSERNVELDNDQRQLSLRDAGGKFTNLTPLVASPPLPISRLDPVFVGASTDLSRVFFESDQRRTPDAPPVETSEVYEWANGEVRVVGILPDGSVAPEGASTSFLDGNVSRQERKWSVSPDGSDVVFQSGTPSQIYLRSDASTTTAISLSQKAGSVGDPAATGARFLAGASPDGKGFSKLYFTSSTELTDDAFTGPTQEGADLYEYDVASGELRDLTANEDPVNPDGAEVSSAWFRTTADGSHLYFIADGALAPGATPNGFQIYVLHEGEISYVAPASLSVSWGAQRPFVSANGKRVLFFTREQLTDESTGDLDQAYVYDQPSGAIDCISCPPGRTPVAGAAPEGFMTGFWHLANAEPNNISADGSRVFFQTAQALDPRDNNGQNDVYEWENGAIRLVSSGQGAEGADFVDASPSGDDVFIATAERILPDDLDDNIDIYDARVNGGFPLPPAPGAPCEGDACQSPPNPPNDATPASAGFRGAGNQKPRSAKARHKGKKQKQKKRKKARHRRQSQKRAAAHRTTTRRHG